MRSWSHPPDAEELSKIALEAPPMLGLEYLDAEALRDAWLDLDTRVRSEVLASGQGIRAYLHEKNPLWRLVGRVTFHLAENKRDDDNPFAFLATYASGVSERSRGQTADRREPDCLDRHAHREPIVGSVVSVRLSEPGPARRCLDIRHRGEATGPKWRPAVCVLAQPYILRPLKTDKRVIADLPEKTEVRAFCGLSREQAALYERCVRDLAEKLAHSEGIQRRGTVLAHLMQLKQICNHPAQWQDQGGYATDRSGKFARLGELCEELAERRERVLVFTQFREITEPSRTISVKCSAGLAWSPWWHGSRQKTRPGGGFPAR